MPFDYSTPPPQSALNLIPAKTITLVRMSVNAGGAGEGGMLTPSKDGACELLRCSLVVLDGPHAKRKVFGQHIVEGPDEKYEEQKWRSVKLLRRVLKSAFNLSANDPSPEAKAKLNVDFSAFDGLVFYARIGIELGNGDWPAKNVLAGTVTRNESDWPGPIEQSLRDAHPPVPPSSPAPAPVSPAAIARPAWAQE